MRNASFARLAVLVLTVSLGSFACATGGDAPTEGEMETATETAAQESKPMETGEILQVLQTINEGEIKQAQFALQRSQNPDVQQTAETIIEDHRAMNERIDRISQDTDTELKESALSRGIETQVSQIQNQLSELSGEQFDREFLRRQIQLHELSLETTREDLMPSATDPQVRQLLSEATGHLEQHLRVAELTYQELQDSAIGGGPEEQDIEEEEIDEDMDEHMDDHMEEEMEEDWEDPGLDE